MIQHAVPHAPYARMPGSGEGTFIRLRSACVIRLDISSQGFGSDRQLSYKAAMHENEITIDVALVRRLIALRFPHWSDLPLKPIASGGTDNVILRLGEDMAVRLPRHPGAAGQIEKEQRWLPQLAPQLPLAIPVPLGMGRPAADYPFHWSICPWFTGETALSAPIADLQHTARQLAGFINALQQIDPTDGPAPGAHNSFRGVALSRCDAQTRTAIASLDGMIDTARATAAWEASLHAPVWRGPPRWLHGDLHPGNLLVEDGRLTAIIDFGCLGVGDPACELLTAWTVLDAEARKAFRAIHKVDDATWMRGRGWALSMGLMALPYYLDSNPVLVAIARRAISETLADD